MRYDFSQSACREDTNAEKYTLREELFGTTDVEPVWVADMDIDTPSFVLEAVCKRLQHPIVGYEEVPDSAFNAQREWMRERNGFEFGLEDMFYSHSVVASIHVAIEAFSVKGEGVIVQTPVYPPFFHSVLNLERKLLKNPLKVNAEGEYTFDRDDLEAKINKDTKLLLLCSPHNPVGRVWRREELEAILEICLKHNIVVFADEIHSDLVYKPNRHISFATLSKEAREITVTAMGVGKSFNMAGFAMSSVVVQNAGLKAEFAKAHKRVHFAEGAVLSHTAFEAAYRGGTEWLEELKIHLYANYEMLVKVADEFSEFIKITPVQATYLAWIDCKGLGLSDKELREFFVKEAKLGLNAGLSFGREGHGYMRLNFGVSRAKMLKVTKRLSSALETKRRDR